MFKKSCETLLIVTLGLALIGCGGGNHEISMQQAETFVVPFFEDGPVNLGPFNVDGKPFSGILTARHSETVKAIEIRMKGGYPDGKISLWNISGQPLLESYARWDAEKRQLRPYGLVRKWRENGSLEIEEQYDSDGRRHGISVTYCESGQQKEAAIYSADELNGLLEAWDCASGNRTSAIGYKNGALDGAIELWTVSGQQTLRVNVSNDRFGGPIELRHPNGQIAEQATLAAEQSNIVALRRNPFGLLRNHGQLSDALRFTGDRKRWSEAGDLLLEASYTDQGEPTGTWYERNHRNLVTRRDYQRDDYVDDEYAPALAQALNGGNPRDAEAIFYYLENDLIQPDKKIEVSMGFMSTNAYYGAITYANRPGGWPRNNWSYIVHGIPFELLPLFLETGADVNARNSEGGTRLMRCAATLAQRGCTAAEIIYLLERGADPHVLDKDGANALRLLGVEVSDQRFQAPNPAVEHPIAFKALLEAGSDINARGANGNTLLMEALRTRKADLATQLIEAGADVQAPNGDGSSPIHFVFLERADSIRFDAGRFSQRMLPLLISKGADINQPLRWSHGEMLSLHQLSLRNGAIDLVKLLEEHGARR